MRTSPSKEALVKENCWRWRVVIVIVAIFVAGCGLSGSAAPSSGATIQATSSAKAHETAPGRSMGAMAYDGGTHGLMMFGGFAQSGPLNDTWAWDGEDWTPRHPATVPTIQNPSMTYDPANRELLVVGSQGNLPQQQNSLWSWKDGTSDWVQRDVWMTPTCGKGCPSPTAVPFGAGALVYDGARSRVLMLTSASAGPGGETWTWDGARWNRIPVTHRPTLLSCCVTPDHATGNLLALGYSGAWGGINRLWIFDGNDWTLSSSPTPTGEAMMIDDPSRGTPLLLRGDSAANTAPGETWSWTGSTWQRLDVTSPPLLSGSSLGYDAADKEVILFGGRDAYGQSVSDTWIWNGHTWSKHP
jgi:hypothetical protein